MKTEKKNATLVTNALVSPRVSKKEKKKQVVQVRANFSSFFW